MKVSSLEICCSMRYAIDALAEELLSFFDLSVAGGAFETQILPSKKTSKCKVSPFFVTSKDRTHFGLHRSHCFVQVAKLRPRTFAPVDQPLGFGELARHLGQQPCTVRLFSLSLISSHFKSFRVISSHFNFNSISIHSLP